MDSGKTSFGVSIQRSSGRLTRTPRMLMTTPRKRAMAMDV